MFLFLLPSSCAICFIIIYWPFAELEIFFFSLALLLFNVCNGKVDPQWHFTDSIFYTSISKGWAEHFSSLIQFNKTIIYGFFFFLFVRNRKSFDSRLADSSVLQVFVHLTNCFTTDQQLESLENVTMDGGILLFSLFGTFYVDWMRNYVWSWSWGSDERETRRQLIFRDLTPLESIEPLQCASLYNNLIIFFALFSLWLILFEDCKRDQSRENYIEKWNKYFWADICTAPPRTQKTQS